ncbi:MAG: sporulation peptidase YabG [Candidatus Desulforudis sp.]|nr:sporulation peptidase YabG [Desulforudis sp.]
MSNLKEGDIVARKSYNFDLYFKVCSLYDREDGQRWAALRGIDIRLCADAPVSDLEKISSDKVAQHWRKVMTTGNDLVRRCFQRRKEELNEGWNRGKKVATFDVPGKVLHLDGDQDYLDLCNTTYRQLGVPAKGYFISEPDQPVRVADLLREHNPDILVLTGHDALKKGSTDFRDINNYRNSRHFLEAVRVARDYEKNRDDLVIFAGACQSYYEALLDAGANFASAPERVLIHAFDPVFVVEKVAYTPVHKPIVLKEVIEATITRYPGIGGLDTQGKYRMGAPKSAY